MTSTTTASTRKRALSIDKDEKESTVAPVIPSATYKFAIVILNEDCEVNAFVGLLDCPSVKRVKKLLYKCHKWDDDVFNKQYETRIERFGTCLCNRVQGYDEELDLEFDSDKDEKSEVVNFKDVIPDEELCDWKYLESHEFSSVQSDPSVVYQLCIL